MLLNHALSAVRTWLALFVLMVLASAAALMGSRASAQNLPPEVDALLARAKVPREALSAIVVDAAPVISGRKPGLAEPLLN